MQDKHTTNVKLSILIRKAQNTQLQKKHSNAANSLAMKITLAEDKTARGSIMVTPWLCQSYILLHGKKLTLSQQRLWKKKAVVWIQRPAKYLS